MSTEKFGDAILLSIDAKFADQILSGEKPFEFRKPNVPDDISYILLVENETRKIPGGFLVGSVNERDIDTLWREFGNGISKKDRFYNYYSGRDRGRAFGISRTDPFKENLSLNEIIKGGDDINAPPQFTYLYLGQEALETISNKSQIINNGFISSQGEIKNADRTVPNPDSIDIRPMNPSEEDLFRDLFSKSPVSDDYEEIDDTFIDHIIEAHETGEDPYGYFTKKKKVYTFIYEGSPIGYTVTTWKRGGSVKYGPTIIKEKHRGKGLGPDLRERLDQKLETEGVRKAYSTIPETHNSAYNYLIKAGYQIEAHLDLQYNRNHSDLVFGKVLKPGDQPEKIQLNRENADSVEFDIGSSGFDGFSEFVTQSMDPWYDEIGQQFVESVQEAESRNLNGDLSKKGKRVYIGHDSGDIKCVIIASRKRGGGVKISPYLSTIYGEETGNFLKFVEEDLSSISGIRKYYTFVPLLDKQLLSVFLKNGYHTEGVLKEPYKSGIDMVVLAKFIEVSSKNE